MNIDMRNIDKSLEEAINKIMKKKGYSVATKAITNAVLDYENLHRTIFKLQDERNSAIEKANELEREKRRIINAIEVLKNIT